MIMMLLIYSILEGLVVGFIFYLIIMMVKGCWCEVNVFMWMMMVVFIFYFVFVV